MIDDFVIFEKVHRGFGVVSRDCRRSRLLVLRSKARRRSLWCWELRGPSREQIAKKVTNSQTVTYNDQRRAATAAANQPAARLPESTFLQALGTPDVRTAPPQTGSLALRAMEEWERSICENQAFAILHRMQTGRSTLIKKDGGEMLVAMALDRPLADAEALVRDPRKLVAEILQITRTSNRTQLSKQWLKPMCEMNYI